MKFGKLPIIIFSALLVVGVTCVLFTSITRERVSYDLIWSVNSSEISKSCIGTTISTEDGSSILVTTITTDMKDPESSIIHTTINCDALHEWSTAKNKFDLKLLASSSSLEKSLRLALNVPDHCVLSLIHSL